jgi:GDP-4-dehydro-6-deoxy-D-mannose reductase
MRVLITGITGFIGGHLAERLLAEGHHDLSGFSRDRTWPRSLTHLESRVALQTLDLLDTHALTEYLTRTRPEWIFHLAGYANTGKSFQDAANCWVANLTGTQSFFHALDAAKIRCRVLFASTGLVYGDPEPGQEDLDERSPLKPASPYATSKAAADLLAYQVTRHPGLDVVRVRLFNQIGPRQSADFALPNFSRQIAAIERGRQPPILQTGDLSAWRDLTDIRDTVQAMISVLQHAPAGDVFNLGRGEIWQMSEMVRRLVAMAEVPIEIQELRSGRIGDTVRSRANTHKVRRVTGWSPVIPLDDSLRDTLNDWRSRT